VLADGREGDPEWTFAEDVKKIREHQAGLYADPKVPRRPWFGYGLAKLLLAEAEQLQRERAVKKPEAPPARDRLTPPPPGCPPGP
jgi:hypothetical protein